MSVTNIATQHLQVINSQLSVLTQNIAAADIDNNEEIIVTQSSVIQNNQPMGVIIDSYSTNVDIVMQAEVYSLISAEAYADEINSVNQYIDDLMGTPVSDDNISLSLNNIFIALQDLSENPTVFGLVNATVDTINSYVERISGVATQLEQELVTIDSNINSQLDELNAFMAEANLQRTRKLAAAPGSLDQLDADQKYRLAIENISAYTQIREFFNSSGESSILLYAGQTIVSDQEFEFVYTPVSSAVSFLNNDELEPIQLAILSPSGTPDLSQSITIVKGGVLGDRPSNFISGSIAALIEIRDKRIPAVLAQLDTLAKSFKDAFNTVHNQGTGHAPLSTMNGTTLVKRDQEFGFSGSVLIGVVDGVGANVTGVDPFYFNLGTLDTGDGAGNFNLEGLMQEINYYFGERINTYNRATVSNLKNISLTSSSKTMTAGDEFYMDFGLFNASALSSTFGVTAISVTDSTSASLPTTVYHSGTHTTVPSGEYVRSTTSGPSVSFTVPVTVNYPLTVNATVTANNGSATTTSVVTYTIESAPTANAFNGLMNLHFPATAIDINGTLVVPPLTADAIVAQIIDDNGNPLSASSTESGRLQLYTTNSNWGIVINSLDSSNVGISTENIIGTDDAFSYYFGLNDLFTRSDSPENWGSTTNTAYYLTLREDINEYPFLLATGIVTQTDGSVSISNGDFSNGINLYQIQNNLYSFPAVGGLGARTVSLSSYAADIITNSANASNSALNNYQSALDSLESVQTNFQNTKGTNINEQMIKLMNLMNVHTAQNRVISMAQKFYEILFQSVT